MKILAERPSVKTTDIPKSKEAHTTSNKDEGSKLAIQSLLQGAYRASLIKYEDRCSVLESRGSVAHLKANIKFRKTIRMDPNAAAEESM